MKKYILIVFLIGCTTSRPSVQRPFAVELPPPLTNTQQTAHIYDLERNAERQDSIIHSQAMEIEALKSTAVIINSIFDVDEFGAIHFKKFLQFDSAAFRFVYVGQDNYDSTKIKKDTLTPTIDTVIIMPFIVAP